MMTRLTIIAPESLLTTVIRKQVTETAKQILTKIINNTIVLPFFTKIDTSIPAYETVSGSRALVTVPTLPYRLRPVLLISRRERILYTGVVVESHGC